MLKEGCACKDVIELDFSVLKDGRCLVRWGARAFSYILRGFCGRPWPDDCPKDELRGGRDLSVCIEPFGCCKLSGLDIAPKTWGLPPIVS